MKRPKYHFLRCERFSNGRSIVTLPGQTFGLNPVAAGVLVKDKKGCTVVARARRKATDGEIFFTTTLSPANGCFTATDIHPISVSDTDIIFSDARSILETLTAQ